MPDHPTVPQGEPPPEPQADRPPEPQPESPPEPRPDLQRRLFFRRFAGEVITAATSVMGAAQALQQQSADAARDMLVAGGAVTVLPSGFRTAFRWEEDVCRVVDQRRLPGALAELEIRGAGDAVTAIRQRAIAGAPAAAQVAAIALALTIARTHGSKPYARRATMRGSATALRQAAPASAGIDHAVQRMLDRYDALPPDSAGDVVSAALRDEAEAIVFEATTAHGRLAAAGLAALPGGPDQRLTILTLGATGALAGGQYGTALGVISSAHHAKRPLAVVLAETRPSLIGTRVNGWELAQAGVPATVVTDAAVGHLLARGEIDLVLVGADRVAANGDIAAIAGTYQMAVMAHRHDVPVFVCVPTTAIDPAVADGSMLPLEDRPAGEVLAAGGTVIGPDGVGATNPGVDVTPAELITALITEEGRLDPPFGESLSRAVESAAAARAAAPRFSQLAPGRPVPGDQGPTATPDGPPPTDPGGAAPRDAAPTAAAPPEPGRPEPAR
jgi:methylthioribose-1-phosphate isomerase